MHPGKRLKQRREELDLSIERLAEHADTTYMSYWDVEAYADEFRTMLDLAQAKRVCGLLQLDLFEVLALDPEVPKEILETPGDRGRLGRGEFIRARREAAGLSAEELADRVGYYAELIESAEADPATLESCCLDVLVDLAKELRVPLASLVVSESQGR